MDSLIHFLIGFSLAHRDGCRYTSAGHGIKIKLSKLADLGDVVAD